MSPFLSSFYPHKSASQRFLKIAIYEAVIGFTVNAFVMCFYFFFHYQSWGFRLSASCLWKLCVPHSYQTSIKESNTSQEKAKYWALRHGSSCNINPSSIFSPHRFPPKCLMSHSLLCCHTHPFATTHRCSCLAHRNHCIAVEWDVSLWHKWGHLYII